MALLNRFARLGLFLTALALSGAGGWLSEVQGGPLDVAGLALWLDASDPNNGGPPPVPGAAITTWLDKSGNARDANNVNGDPNYLPNMIGGNAAINFDGNDWMWTTYNFDPITEYTVFGIARYAGNDNERIITSRTRNWLFGHHGNYEDRWHAEGWIYPAGGAAGSVVTRNFAIHAGTINNVADPQASFWRNGNLLVLNSTGSGAGNHMIGQLQLGAYGTGGSETSISDIAEILVYNRVLNATELNDIGWYLSRKYGLASSYTQPAQATTLTWDGTSNNWGTPHWIGGPPPFPNEATTAAVVNSGQVVVEANYAAHSLAVTGASAVNIGAGNTLTLEGPANVTGATASLNFGADAKLVAAGGTVSVLKTTGNATIQAMGGTPLTVSSLDDQNVPGTLTKQGSGTLTIDNSAGTNNSNDLAFKVDSGLLRGIGANPLGGTEVTLNGGTLELKGVQTVLNTNALQHRGYHAGPDANLFNISGNTNLWLVKPYGTPLFTSGPGNRGLDFGSDADWGYNNAVSYGDNYSNLITGYLNVTTPGNYTFRVSRDDDWSAIWFDLNQDGVFTSYTGTLATNNAELIAWEDGGTKTLNLQPGKYRVAFGHAEGGGGSSLTVQFRSPTMGAEAPVKPADAAQAGLWSVEDVAAINAPTTNLSVIADSGLRIVTDYSATLGSLTMNAGTTLTSSGGVATFTGGLAVNGGGPGRNITLAVDNTNLTMESYTDGATATNLIKNGLGTLTLKNVSTVAASTFRVNAGKLVGVASSPPLGNAETLILSGGTFEAQGAATTVPNALVHIGYDYMPDSAMNLHNNAGLMALAPYSRTLMNRNLASLFSDHDFLGAGVVSRWDNYMNLWIGYLNVTPATTGTYQFKYDGDDDRGMIWLDINQNGIFQSNTGNLGTNNGELLAWEDGGTKSVNLTTPGLYMFAVGHGEYGGGSNLNRAQFAPPGGGLRLISPGNPNQAGYWSANAMAAVDMSSTDVSVVAGTTTSVLRALTDYDATFRDLDLGTGSTLTLSGAKMNFASTDFTPGSTLVLGTNGANLGALRTAGGQSNIGSTTNVLLDGFPVLPRAVPTTYNDQGIAGSTMRIYAAALELDNSTPGNVVAGNTNFRVEAQGLLRAAATPPATPPLGAGNPLVTLAGGTLALMGQPDGTYVANALSHIGYNGTPERSMDLEGTNGLVLQNGVLARVPYNRVPFTDGAAFGYRGLYPQSDAEFVYSGAVGQVDNYTNIWTGYLNVTTTGNHTFRIGGDDDRSGIWVDLNQNGIFETVTGGLESNNGELIAWEDTGTKTINFTSTGLYRVAIVHGEFGGGSNVQAYFRAPGMGGEALILPSSPAQAGKWSYPRLDNINATNTNVTLAASSTISALTDGAARLGTLTLDGSTTNTFPTLLTTGGGTIKFTQTNLTEPNPFTSYIVPAGQVGNQAYTGSLGMDFDLIYPLVLTSLGIFDSGSDGLSAALSVRLYDRTNTATPVTTLTFTPGDPGTLVGGSRFKDLATPLMLPAGFRGSIVASGFNATDLNGNAISPLPWTTWGANGAISFVGGGRYGTDPNTFPATGDGGPANRYAAGTFNYIAGTYAGLNPAGLTTVYTGPLNGSGAVNRFFSQGMGDVVLDQPGTGLANTRLEARGGGGRMVVTSPAAVAGARLDIGSQIADPAGVWRGGQLVLTSPDGNDTTYPNAIGAYASGALIGGPVTVFSEGSPTVIGASTGSIILPNFQPTEGAIVQMKATMSSGAIILPNGVNSPSYVQPNALAHYGYHINNDALVMDLNLNAGMVNNLAPAGFQALFGKEVFTSGPQGRGLDYNDDIDFIASGAIGQIDNYSNIWLGKLTVPPALAGNWNFRINAQDDPTGIWIDLNRNGIFESNTPGLASDRGEQLLWNAVATRTVNLAAGEYLVAFTHREGGGGSQIEAQFQAPGMPALKMIKPSDPAQAGLWSMPVVGGGLDIAQGETRTLKALNLATLILSPGGWLNRAAPQATDRNITVTDRLDMYRDLDMTQGEILTTTGAEVTVRAGANLFIDHPVNARILNLQGNLVRTGAGSQADVTVTQALNLSTTLNFAPGTLNSAGATITVNPTGVLTSDAPITAKALASSGTTTAPGANLTDLYVGGGTTTLTGNTTVTGTFSGPGGTLAAANSLTIAVGGAVGFDGTVRVDSGTLTFNVPATNTTVPMFGRQFHIAADAMTGLSNGQTVGFWRDLSGLEHSVHLYNSDPAYTTNVLNGLPVVRFDTDDRMQTIYNFDPLTSYSVFTTARYTGGASARVISSATRNWLFGFHSGLINRWHAEGWIYPEAGAGGVAANTNWYIHAGTIGPGPNPPASFWSQGVQLLSGSYDSGDTNYMIGRLQLNGYNNGNNEMSAADIAEILIYDRLIGPNERNAIGAYLATKYALATSYYAGPALGDIRLASSAQLTFGGAGAPQLGSVGTLASPTVTGPFVVAPGTNFTASPDGETLTINGPVLSATKFNVSGPGTVALTQNVTIAPGGGIASTANGNISALNTLTIDAATAAGVSLQGGLNVASGTLTFNVPASVAMPSGLAGWYDATDINNGGPQPANGDIIALWRDKSGNARDLGGSGNYSSDPNLNTAGPGGRATVTFDGDDWIRSAYNFDPLTNYTVLALARYTGGDNERVISSTGRNWLFGFHGGYEDRWHAEGWIYGDPAGPAQTATTNWRLYAGTVGPATSNPPATFWRDGYVLTTNSYGSGDANYYIGQLELGAYGGSNETSRCEVSEVLIFNRVLTAAELNAVGGYLTSKYGLTTAYTGMLGLPNLGNLTMANATTLILGGGGAAAFQSITTGPTATIQGAATLLGDMRVGGSPGTLNVSGAFTMGAGSTYHWEHDGTTSDLVAISGSPGNLNLAYPWNLGVSLGAIIPDGSYDLFTYTGALTSGGAVTLIKENAYANLINSWSVSNVPGSPNRVVLNLDLADVSLWTSNSGSGGTTAWNVATNWNSGAGPVPTSATPAIVQAPTADRIATVTAAMGPQDAHSLIVDNGGHVLIEPGGNLRVANNADVLATGSLTVNGTLKVGSMSGPPPGLLSGLIGYWPFNEGSGITTADASGNNNPGAIQPGATWVNDGTRGWVLDFPAAGSVIIPPAAFSSLAYGSQVTVSLWQYGDPAAQPRNDTIFGGNNGGNRVIMSHIPWGDSNVYWDAGNVGGTYDRINRGASPAEFEGAWHNWVFVKDATTGSLAIYLDGSLWHSGTGLTRTMEPITAFRIGSDAGGGGSYDGMIDDFAVWNRSLSASDIQTLYQLGLAISIQGALTTAGTTTFGENAVLDIPRINVIGGTTTGYPLGTGTPLQASTTLRLAGGHLAGIFNASNPTTVAGYYAYEIESGTSAAALNGPLASLRKSTAGTATLSGGMNLNRLSMEAGTLILGNGPDVNLNTINVSGGTLVSEAKINVGTLNFQGGTMKVLDNVNITSALSGGSSLISDGDVTINASAASRVAFTGTLQVTDTQPAGAGHLLFNVPAASLASAVSQNFDAPGTPYTNRSEGTGPCPVIVTGGPQRGNAMRLAQSNIGSHASSIAFDRTITGPQNAVSAHFDLFAGFGADGGAFALLNTANYGTSGQGPTSPPWEEPNLTNSFAVGFDVYDNIYEVSLHWAGAVRAVKQVYDYRDKGWVPVDVDLQYVPGGAYVYLDIAGRPIYTGEFIAGMTPYEARAAFGARTGGTTMMFQVDNIDVQMGSAITPRLGNLQLDPETQFTLGGAGTAHFNTMSVTGGLSVTGSLTLGPTVSGPANVRGYASGLAVSGTVDARTFELSGSGGFTLLDQSRLTVGSSGVFKIPAGNTLGSQGNTLVDITQATPVVAGTINVASGTLTLNVPAVAGPAGAAAYYSFDSYSGTTVFNQGTLGAAKDGVLTDGAAITGSGRVGSGMSIADDSNQRLVIGANTGGQGIDIGAEWTIAAWYNNLYPVPPNAWRTLTRGAQNDHQIIVRDSNNDLGIYANGRGDFRDSGADLLPNQGWHHIAAVGKPNNTTDFYVDGVYVGTADRSSTSEVSTIGNYLTGGQPFAQTIDEFVLYNHALDANAIAGLYKAGFTGNYAPRLGNLVMAPGTTLVVGGGGAVGFSNATVGSGARVTGDLTIDQRLNVQDTFTIGSTFTMSHGMIYEWDLRGGGYRDLVDVLGDLRIDGAFTLRIFGAGGNAQPADVFPLILFDTDLYVGGQLVVPPESAVLDYIIELGNAADPNFRYIWDLSGAQIVVLRQPELGLYLTGLQAILVPEPTTVVLLALGGVALLRRRCRCRR